ncbi:putative cysteine-rich receptor-like protein kinase 31 [Corylus avellana]|uniref:putative cysteine-rich receptor-like protein kinase 31 n=1 Tax=Corylus avellana TaxID=13451 RepID=UPI00286B6ED6|nr:putative cysteine-rich receptor-like protein kinase 31 [Corylus avellana]XP_059461589.1 putative cysteine-rich receptor-like protein kinase 31 [Corylus avellana]
MRSTASTTLLLMRHHHHHHHRHRLCLRLRLRHRHRLHQVRRVWKISNCDHYSCALCCSCGTSHLHLHLFKSWEAMGETRKNAKISDFGMARLFEFDQIEANTSRIVGTFGYMASEYGTYGQFSVKSDVFNFGMEKLGGDNFKSCKSHTEIMRCIHIGLLCVQENVTDRPAMASVFLMLNTYSITLPEPSQATNFEHNDIKLDVLATGA